MLKIHNRPFKRISTDHILTVFDNPMAAYESISAIPTLVRSEMDGDKSDFYSRETWRDLSTRVVSGDPETAKSAERIMSQIKSLQHDTIKRQRVRSPFGKVCVGSYLASDPMPARRSVRKPSNRAPLSIVVGLNSRADVSSAKLEKRGVAIAALTRSLIKVRPVNLYMTRFCDVSGGGNSCALIKFPTAPIDTYRLAYCLSSQGFARGMLFGYHNNAGHYAKQVGNELVRTKQSQLIRIAGSVGYAAEPLCPFTLDLQDFLNTEVLYIPGSYPGTKGFDRMTNNPVQWINETMEALTKPI